MPPDLSPDLPPDLPPEPWPGERPLVLASSSRTRIAILRAAGLSVVARPARVDEEAVTASLLAEGARPRDVADALAEMKAARVAGLVPAESLVIGADQVGDCGGRLLTKPATPDDAAEQLRRMSGRDHRLYAAAVVYDGGVPVWRHVAEARLRVHDLSDAFIERYVARNWEVIRTCAGGYAIEGEGVRLMSRIEGDLFAILGLPLTDLLTWLRVRGDIAG